tara:strand:- start:11783 stop:12169 length:387 start_codon:yes stop_codon:yes gene_type:complete
MRLEKNFTLKEFQCKDGSPVPPGYIGNVSDLCENLQVLRDYIQRPIIVISGYRSPSYNKKISGAKKSQHLLAKAADIIVHGMTSLEVRDTILLLIREGKMKKGGVGIYPTFTHYDVRGYNARWGSYKK